ncbi:hypothetical protein V1477_017073 [Vespula maculifrons]|uniref:Uncharacterized protein n=1 Tax=Vespula maculifrons TaxID=7453 RepID=A0ABD2B4Y7_VESMC
MKEEANFDSHKAHIPVSARQQVTETFQSFVIVRPKSTRSTAKPTTFVITYRPGYKIYEPVG